MRHLGHIHASDVVEGVLWQSSRVIMRRIDPLLNGTIGHAFAGDLSVTTLKAMFAKEATAENSAGNVSFDLNLAHFYYR